MGSVDDGTSAAGDRMVEDAHETTPFNVITTVRLSVDRLTVGLLRNLISQLPDDAPVMTYIQRDEYDTRPQMDTCTLVEWTSAQTLEIS